MKLATLNDGSRDGRLVVVSRNLMHAAPTPRVKTLQAALDDWDAIAPELQALAARLDQGMIAGTLGFDPRECMAPLPRAYQWADGSAYLNHVELVRKARGAELPPELRSDPLLYQGGSDCFLGPTQPIPLADEAWGCDLEAEVAVVTGDVARGCSAEQGRAAVRLLLLVNDVSLRGLVPAELAKGFGFFQSKPSSALSPCAVTPDELGAAWDGGRLHLPLLSAVNGARLGRPDAGAGMEFDFGTLIAHAARTRPLGAGTIIGAGTVSNRGADGGPGRPVGAGGAGYSCLAELRSVETLLEGKPRTPFLRWGDRVRIEMLDASGQSVFGAIEQTVERS